MMAEPRQQHTPEDERTIREAALDRTIEGSFPASDPPSTAPNPYDRSVVVAVPLDRPNRYPKRDTSRP